MLSPNRPQRGQLLDNDGLPLPPRTRSYNQLLAENAHLRRRAVGANERKGCDIDPDYADSDDELSA